MDRRYVMRLRRPRFRGIRTPVDLPQDSVRRLMLLGIAAAVLLAPIWAWTTQTVAGQRVGDLILFGRPYANPAAVGLAGGTLATISLPAAALATIGLAGLGLVRGGFGLAIAVVFVVIGPNVTSQVLKVLLERPNLLGTAAFATGNSFPSGHVALAASLGLACILVVPRQLRTPTALVVAGLVAAVGVSTITAGWHRLGDVVGAVLIALAWAAIATAVLVRAQGWMPRRTWGRGRGGVVVSVAWLLGGAAVLAGIAGMVLSAIDPTPIREAIAASATEPRRFFDAIVVSLGSVLLACFAYVWAMRGVALESPR